MSAQGNLYTSFKNLIMILHETAYRHDLLQYKHSAVVAVLLSTIYSSRPTRGVKLDDQTSRVQTPLVTINLRCANYPWVRQVCHSSPSHKFRCCRMTNASAWHLAHWQIKVNASHKHSQSKYNTLTTLIDGIRRGEIYIMVGMRNWCHSTL